MHPGVLSPNADKTINLKRGNLEVVDRFSYLRDMLSTEGGAQKSCNVED